MLSLSLSLLYCLRCETRIVSVVSLVSRLDRKGRSGDGDEEQHVVVRCCSLFAFNSASLTRGHNNPLLHPLELSSRRVNSRSRDDASSRRIFDVDRVSARISSTIFDLCAIFERETARARRRLFKLLDTYGWDVQPFSLSLSEPCAHRRSAVNNARRRPTSPTDGGGGGGGGGHVARQILGENDPDRAERREETQIGSSEPSEWLAASPEWLSVQSDRVTNRSAFSSLALSSVSACISIDCVSFLFSFFALLLPLCASFSCLLFRRPAEGGGRAYPDE